MIRLSTFTDTDYERLADAIEQLSTTKSEAQILEIIGNGLRDEGYQVATDDPTRIIEPIAIDQDSRELRFPETIRYVADTEAGAESDAVTTGRNFWQRFTDRLRTYLCTDAGIRKLMSGDGALKDYLKIGIPIVLAGLGIGTLSPVMLAIVASVFALIIRKGWEAYCDLPNAPAGDSPEPAL